MEVKWLNKALKNLDQEAEYIATDNPEAARLIVQQISSSIALLAKNPSLGHPGRIIGTRELIVNKIRYLVPYRVRNESIEILRIFHTSRKLPKSW